MVHKSTGFWVPITDQKERDRLLSVGFLSGYKVNFQKTDKFYHVTWTA